MNFLEILRSRNLEKVKSLAMAICSIPSMFYITDVKAYNRLSISQIGI